MATDYTNVRNGSKDSGGLRSKKYKLHDVDEKQTNSVHD